MARLRVIVWVLSTGLAAGVLLRDLGWSEDPAVAVMAVVRAGAGLSAAYLCAATVLAIRLPRLAPRFVRRLVAGAVGTGLLVAPMTAAAEPREPTAVEVPVLRRVPGSDDRAAVEAATAPTPAQPGVEVVVAPGDHLWSIAERALLERLGRAPTDEEIVPFWTELIELNRDRLATADADLIFAGQVFRLPS